jgi:hypothetical protein
MGLNIALPWYATLLGSSHAFVIQRALTGWGRFLICELGGAKEVDYATMHQGCLPCFVLTFHLVDVAFHFLPPLMLLQLAADNITLLSVAVAYSLTRLWTVCVTFHHLQIDWGQLRKSGWRQLRIRRVRSKNVTSFDDVPVFNMIYGFEPPLPPSNFSFLLRLEIVASIILGIVSMFPPVWRSAGFRTLGAADIADISTMTSVAQFCMFAGILSVLTGFVLVVLPAAK